MRFHSLAVVTTLCIIAFISCGKVEEQDAKYPRNQSFFVGGSQWGEATTFNPLSDWPAWPANGRINGTANILFETLLMYNMLTGEVEPLLAESYQLEENGISIILNPKARWNDGRPVTAKDIQFTFEIGKKYKNVPVANVWDYIADITVEQINEKGSDKKSSDKENTSVSDQTSVKITFIINQVRKNPLVLMDILCGTDIIPEHVYGALLKKYDGDISKVKMYRADDNPVASGPYRLIEDSPEKIVLMRDSTYWGNDVYYGGRQPAPKYIIHPIFKSNDHYSLALQQGKLDVSETFIPRIWLKVRKGVGTWHSKAPYFIPGSIPMFVLNVLQKPLDDVRFRRALAFSINYADIRDLAVSGYSDSLSSGLILPFGKEKKYFHKGDADSLGVRFDPNEARRILKDAGYTSLFNTNGELVEMRGPDGAVIPTIYIKSPVGWSDWESIVRIAVKSMREVGIDVRQKFIDATIYFYDRPLGRFDIMLDNPAPDIIPSRPWSRFETVSSSKDWRPIGERMNRNFGRYKKESVDSLLNLIPQQKSESELLASYRKLNQLIMKDMPVIPVVYRPQMYYEYSTKHWKNFPTEQNPYAQPTSLVFGAGVKALWEIKAVEQE